MSPDAVTSHLASFLEAFHHFSSGLPSLFREIEYLAVETALFLIFLLGLLHVFTVLVRHHFPRHSRPDDLAPNSRIKEITSMSRKFDRRKKINQTVWNILEDPATLHYLGTKLIRRKPKLLPRFAWRLLLLIVLAPSTRDNPNCSPRSRPSPAFGAPPEWGSSHRQSGD